MRDEIVVAVVDTGVDHAKLRTSVKAHLYRNSDEVPGNGRDDDGNGLVDDVTGPSTGPASNHHYQVRAGSSHGSGMVSNVSAQIGAAEGILAARLPVSIMPVSMFGDYYENIVRAAEAGASVISLSHNLSYAQKAAISDMLRRFDAIAVTVDRDPRPGVNPDAGEGPGAPFDNVIEVALISDRIVRGNGGVDLLEVGRSLADTSESHAISNVAGKIAAIWGVDPSLSAAQVLRIVAASTTRDHPTVRAEDLHSEMGGRIDLATGLALAREGGEARPGPAAPDPQVPPGAGPGGSIPPFSGPTPTELSTSGPSAGGAVSARNDTIAFAAGDVSASGGRGRVTFAAADLLANDRGDARGIAIHMDAMDGDVTLSRDGTTLSYAFDLAGFDGRDAFTYRLQGADGSKDYGRVYLRIATDGLSVAEPPSRPAPAPATRGEGVLAINIGSDRAHVAADGTVFAADTTGVGRASSTRAAISGTRDDDLYRSGVWSADGLAYDLDVADGLYAVRLHFAEIWRGAFADGVRVFDVAIEGETAVEGLDIHAAAGARAAHVVERRVEVADGTLDIDLLAGRQNPALSAIEVVRLDAPVDQAPRAQDDALVFDWDRDVEIDPHTGTGSVVFWREDLVSNDDAGAWPQIEVTEGPTDAVLGLAGEASQLTLVVDPARFDGQASFTYRVRDEDGAVSDPATVAIELRGMPEPSAAPTRLALADAQTDRELFTLAASTILEADSLEGRPLTVVAHGAAEARSARLRLDGGSERVENVEPFALFGDRSGDLAGGLDLGDGSEVVVGAELFAGRRATGAALGEVDAALRAQSGIISGGRYHAPDVFAFDETRMGEDRVRHFEAFDRIAFFGDGGLEARDVLDRAQVRHGDTVIDFGEGNVLTLQSFVGLGTDHILL